MQYLESAYKINECQPKEHLLSIVSDKYCRSILKAITDKPKSAVEIAYETKVPITTVYRRMQTLHDNKLVQASGMITGGGKRSFLYKSKIKGIIGTYSEGQVDVEIIPNK